MIRDQNDPRFLTPPAPMSTARCGWCEGTGKEQIANDPDCPCECHLDFNHILQLKDKGELSMAMALDMIEAKKKGKAYCKWCEDGTYHKCLACDGKGEA